MSCHHEWRPGRKSCAACATRNVEKVQKRYQELKRKGLCPKCGKYPAGGRVSCAACLEKSSERWRREHPGTEKPVIGKDADHRMRCAKCDKFIQVGEPTRKVWKKWRHAECARTKAEIARENGPKSAAERRLMASEKYWSDLYKKLGYTPKW